MGGYIRKKLTFTIKKVAYINANNHASWTTLAQHNIHMAYNSFVKNLRL
jgi:hypothetical protein